MTENLCAYHTDHENRIRKNEKEIDDLDDRVTDCEKNNAVMYERMTAAVEKLSRLPEAIDDLKMSNIELKNDVKSTKKEVSDLKMNFDEMKEKIEKVDDKGKFDFLLWIKSNWIGIGVGIAGIIAYGSTVLK